MEQATAERAPADHDSVRLVLRSDSSGLPERVNGSMPQRTTGPNWARGLGANPGWTERCDMLMGKHHIGRESAVAHGAFASGNGTGMTVPQATLGRNRVKLNIGCGRGPEPGWVNADIRITRGVDIRLNAEKPLPFKTGSVDGIRALGILEHLFHWENLMEEAARILRPGADFEIRVPYRMDYVAYHVRHFDENTFNPYRSDYFPRELDFVRRKHTWGSLEFQEPYFTLEEMWVQHRVPFSWHLEKYLHLKAWRLPLGPKMNLILTLRRNESAWKR